MQNDNLAYAVKKFETEEQLKDNNKVQIEKVEIKKAQVKPTSGLKVFIIMAYVLGLCSMLIYGQVRLAEENVNLLNLEEQMQEVESESVRLDLKLQGLATLKNIEDIATTDLGLVEANQSQIEYVAISDSNKIEVIRDTSNIMDEIVKFYNQIKEYFES